MDPDRGGLWSLPGSITIEHEEAGQRVLSMRGDLDAAVIAEFSRLQGRDPVVVDAIDAGSVTFISSTGLALMLRSAEASAAAGRWPVLRAASHSVKRLLQLAGMDSAFPRPEPGTAPSREDGAGQSPPEGDAPAAAARQAEGRPSSGDDR